MSTRFKNGSSDDIIGPASTLASGVSVGATSMTVATGTGDRFPVVASPDIAYVTLQNATKVEIVKITARAAGADTMTIVKAQEGTTDRAWMTGDVVSMRLTAAQAESAVNAQDVAAAALAAHTGDTADAHDASAVSYDPTGTAIVATDVQAALTELDADLTAHQTDSVGAHAASAISNTPAGSIAATTVQDAINELDSEKTTTAYVDAAVAAVAKAATVRHTVLGGPVDSSGYPAPGGSTGGTSITTTGISASAPFVVGFANGFDAGGEVNLFGISTANLSWSGLSTNGTMYLYVDYNAGGLTTGSTTLAPTYQNGGTYSTASGQATFNISEMVMKVGDGAAANQTNRVFVGEVTVAGGVVTAITWYAYRGRYVSPVFAITSNTDYAYSHNIGVDAQFLCMSDACGPSSTNLGYEGYRIQAEAGTVYGFHRSGLGKKAITLNVLNLGRGYYGGTPTHAQIKVWRAF